MFSLYDRVPSYLLGKSQLIGTVMFTALFSLVALLASVPFSHNAWFNLRTSDAFTYTAIFIIISFLVIVASKRTMYYTRNKFSMTILQYIMWNMGEVFIICILYTIFTIKGNELEIIQLEDASELKLFFNALVYCIVTLCIPYVLCAMYYTILDKDNTIRLINFSSVVSDEPTPAYEENKITLVDTNGIPKLSLKVSSLYYFESDDNYIKVWYTDSKGELKQYMLRCRLKTIEDSFSGSDLVRCNRKYIVNMSKVQILSKHKDAYYLDLGNEAIDPIPVTKTYEEQILALFNSR